MGWVLGVIEVFWVVRMVVRFGWVVGSTQIELFWKIKFSQKFFYRWSTDSKINIGTYLRGAALCWAKNQKGALLTKIFFLRFSLLSRY